MAQGAKVLVVDDNEDVRDLVVHILNADGFHVFSASEGLNALSILKANDIDLVLLDVMMPVMDGIETCQIIRKDLHLNQPIIAFLTARTEDYAQIAGFEAGADDYINKPIRPRLLLSKIESLLRRIKKSSPQQDSSIVIDRDRFVVELNGESLALPKKEFELLELLASRPGKVFNRDQILAVVWGNETVVGERTIDVHIRKLREKLGDDYIRTIKGVGYTFKDK